MHIECLTIENVYAAIYKGSKGKIQHFNAFAFLLPMKQHPFLTLSEHKTRGLESSLTKNIPYLIAELLS